MQRARGFSLVEIMISIVILSVGLLGTAGLVAASLKGGNSSYYRSQATVLADDMIDRMRASITAATQSSHLYNIDFGTDLTVACSSSVTGTIPRYDCENWKTAVMQNLPDGDGYVNVDTNRVATVKITWGDGDTFTTYSQL